MKVADGKLSIKQAWVNASPYEIKMYVKYTVYHLPIGPHIQILVISFIKLSER